MAKWLSVRLRTKWLWVRIPLLTLKAVLVPNLGIFIFARTSEIRKTREC